MITQTPRKFYLDGENSAGREKVEGKRIFSKYLGIIREFMEKIK